jgi:protein-tyrosine phosphatase
MISHIHKGIYQSGKSALEQSEQLRADGIRAVVRLDRAWPVSLMSAHWPADFSVLYVPFDDGTPVPEGVFEKVTPFMHEALSGGGKVLVHCQMGISRSTTMVLAYLIEYEGMSLPDAFRLVHQARPLVWPHMALIRSLAEHYRLPYSANELANDEFLARMLGNEI